MVKMVQSWGYTYVQHQEVVKVVQMVKTVPSWLLGEEEKLFSLHSYTYNIAPIYLAIVNISSTNFIANAFFTYFLQGQQEKGESQ